MGTIVDTSKVIMASINSKKNMFIKIHLFSRKLGDIGYKSFATASFIFSAAGTVWLFGSFSYWFAVRRPVIVRERKELEARKLAEEQALAQAELMGLDVPSKVPP